ncbi:hypothetical protein XELAEV_18007821mg [Xenopus laevis]|uniref:Uncharacterized protein n=1 Tax=Xenopus laevis TaxID=8355 RepID=A0A974E1I1_XENLA|nr:hypothetical protein XELAEV_18007821mg [Xenopus laevis]
MCFTLFRNSHLFFFSCNTVMNQGRKCMASCLVSCPTMCSLLCTRMLWLASLCNIIVHLLKAALSHYLYLTDRIQSAIHYACTGGLGAVQSCFAVEGIVASDVLECKLLQF